MKDSASVLEAHMRYAVHMVRTGFITPEQAARTYGVPLPALQTVLGESAISRMPRRPPMPSRSMNTWVPV